MLIEIKNIYGRVIHSLESESLKTAVESLVASRANLTRANLAGANLTDANLTDANLTRANLAGANLTDANLTDANLTDANLTGANLTDADLTGADLTGADLAEARRDLLAALALVPNEIPFLRQSLVEGKIDGSCHQGECACLAGTIARAKNIAFEEFKRSGVFPVSSSSPRERWFLAISPGQTPENNRIARITLGWIDEAMAANQSLNKSVPV